MKSTKQEETLNKKATKRATPTLLQKGKVKGKQSSLSASKPIEPNPLNVKNMQAQDIQQEVISFIGNLFKQQDFTKIPTKNLLQAQVKLIEILNKNK